MKGKKEKGSTLDYRKKDRKKTIRTVFQVILLVFLSALLMKAAFNHKSYTAPDPSTRSNEKGFIALSYFGVSTSRSETLIAKKQLEEQLQALKDNGYVTVSQQDLIDFYQKGKPLPDKALFLTFEDGRNDSAIYAQALLEKYNFKATVLTYADKFGEKKFKFLQPKELLEMKDSGYWEIGSNGYRLTYINNYDKDGYFIDRVDETDFETYDIKKYNHYLMDFLRDKNGIPIEDRAEMEERIHTDYQLMKEIYSKELGFVPDVYMIMHANSLYNGMNNLVEKANDQNIKLMFKLHFNREGQAFNAQNSNPYDLTRVQPAPNWSVNHLLMKIREDSGQKVNFVLGDKELAKDWKLEGGAVQFAENKLILTSPPGREALLYLKNKDFSQNYRINLMMEGVPEGKQSIYLRFNQQKGTSLKLVLENRELSVIQTGVNHKAEVLKREEVNKGEIVVEMTDHQLSLWQDEKPLFEKLPFDASLDRGGLALASEPRETKDDQEAIYDSVFTDLQIVELNDSKTLFSNTYSGVQKVIKFVEVVMNDLIDWTLTTF
jgi:hypothetical protein